MLFRSQHRKLDLSFGVAVVGVVNVTPDSYFPESRISGPEEIVGRVRTLTEEGADVIEIGGESTGPGSTDVSPGEELGRVIPAVKKVREAFPDVWISVDTNKSAVAKEALLAGADMVNDVTAGQHDPEMFSVIAGAGCPYVIMYSKDPTPRTTVSPRQYSDVVETVKSFLIKRKAEAVAAGVKESQIIIDPGLGHFLSSDTKYSFEVIKRLKEFTDLGPVFLSPSRKSFLAGPRNDLAAERLPATLAVTVIAVLNGARLIRTHDVAATKRAIAAAWMICSAKLLNC
ncbi:dihydropteroate synthase [Candidatus Peribacteria bacterium RIFCSPLOWO2_01_FULL_51_18]|nr:MAG: dihydropteroate synthase [Candidatus Peribacteria bacterium RIFCSPHIGHO2_02_FULL_51_15]OGJ66772.1 MAG: dihydropteroate synthase [Candidatus Peribacteria bacterium RIFCSPLOWO2_01_FULL_51_18]OGJ67211.1 MAG: dihydropteroate synthase [Candidatus Peribacteria bacterium RIFCSPLOWO2_02_FULL_51_10]